MLGELFQQVEMAGHQIGAQALNHDGVIDGIADIVAGPGRSGRHPDLQGDFDGLRHGFFAGIDTYPGFCAKFFNENDVHLAAWRHTGVKFAAIVP